MTPNLAQTLQNLGNEFQYDPSGRWGVETVGPIREAAEIVARLEKQQAAVVPAPDGRLNADGYFTWAHRAGYVLDKRLPCDFWLAPPAVPALTDAQIDAMQSLADFAQAVTPAPWFGCAGRELDEAAQQGTAPQGAQTQPEK